VTSVFNPNFRNLYLLEPLTFSREYVDEGFFWPPISCV